MGSVEIFKAMADESRLRLVHALSRNSFNVQELTAIIQLGQSTISHHLKTLQSAGIVAGRREGTWVYYTLANGSGPALAHSITEEFLNQSTQDELSPTLSEDSARINEALAQRRDRARTYFDTVAPRWSELRSQGIDHTTHLQELAKRIPAKADLLELGCGSGALLSQITPRPGTTIGVDFSQAMLAEAKKVLPKDVELRLGYLEHLPLADESVDIAVAYMVFHHLANPLEALRDTFRVLRRGGVFVIVDLLKHAKEEMRDQFADQWLGFDPNQLQGWAKQAHFCKARAEVSEARDVFMFTCEKGNRI